MPLPCGICPDLENPGAKIRAQYNVPESMGIVDAVDHIMAESACRRAMYTENCRLLHTVVDKIESEARDYLAIRDRVREAQIGFLQRSCRLPLVAMFSKEPQASSRVMDIVSGLDWASRRVLWAEALKDAQVVAPVVASASPWSAQIRGAVSVHQGSLIRKARLYVRRACMYVVCCVGSLSQVGVHSAGHP